MLLYSKYASHTRDGYGAQIGLVLKRDLYDGDINRSILNSRIPLLREKVGVFWALILANGRKRGGLNRVMLLYYNSRNIYAQDPIIIIYYYYVSSNIRTPLPSYKDTSPPGPF